MSLSSKSLAIKDYVDKMITYLKREDIQSLRRSDNQKYFEKTQKKFTQLKELIPALFNMIIDLDNPNEFEMDRLDNMLYMRDRIRENQISTESASAQIGQQYFDEYVKPHVDMSKENHT